MVHASTETTATTATTPPTTSASPYALIVFDLDGTLMRPTGGKQWPANEEDREPLPGRIEKCLSLGEAGVCLAVATNQGGVAYGMYDRDKLYAAIVSAVYAAFGIAYVEMCPHHPKGRIGHLRGECLCRKPRPGMLIKLMDLIGAAPEQTLFVGDRAEDEEAARSAGVDFAWADEFFLVGADEEGVRHAARA